MNQYQLFDCNCDICQQRRIFQSHVDGLTEAQKPYFVTLYDTFFEVQADLDYYKALVDGSWPEADVAIARKRKLNEHI